MALQIHVIGENRRVNKVIAALLVRRAIADWVEVDEKKTSIKMRPLLEYKPVPERIELPAKAYVPDDMPNGEVRGCRFMPPVVTHDPSNTIVHVVRIQQFV